MYGVNNVTKNSVFNAAQLNNSTRGAKESTQKPARTDEILFSATDKIQTEVKSVQISEKADNYLQILKKKFGDEYDFIIADYETDEEASALLSKGKGEINVVITPDLLEKMARDEDTRAKYEDIIANASEQLDELEESLGDNKDAVKTFGVSVKDGVINYYALLTEGLKTADGSDTVKASSTSELAKLVAEIAEKRAKEEEEAEKAENKESVLPPKSFEKFDKEPNPYSNEENFGTLPPESFQKYQGKENPYATEEDYGTLPPKSFEKYKKADEPTDEPAMNFKV